MRVVLTTPPVYVLDLTGYSISEMGTSGEMPGWISKHEANFDAEGFITIHRGQVIEGRGGEQRFRSNFEDYALDIASGAWRRLTNRNWRQFKISQKDGKLFVLDRHPQAEVLMPRGIEQLVVPSEKGSHVRIVIDGVPVSLTVGLKCIEMVVEGSLSDELSLRLAEEIRANAQAAIGRPCVIEEI